MAVLGEDGPADGLVLPRRSALRWVAGAAVVVGGSSLLEACGTKPITVPGAVATKGGSSVTVSSANPKSASTMVASTANGVNLVATGTSINGTADDFSYYFVQASGKGTWSCQIAVQPHASGDGGYGQAGIVARASGAPGSPEIAVLSTTGNGVILRWRDTLNGAMNQWPTPIAIGANAPTTAGGTPQLWLQLSMTSPGVFAPSYSQDGKTWANEGVNRTMSFGTSTFLIGLAACAHAGTDVVDQFTNLSGFKGQFYYLDVNPANTTSTSKSSSS